ncbi:MAG: TIGR01777 family oxidoreductase [Pirellulaceae bacterium]
MLRAFITGATGVVGQVLLEHFTRPTITSRSREKAEQKLGNKVEEVIEWDPVSGLLPLTADRAFDVVVNLMGESIAEGRWTAARKKRIRDSRVVGTRNLVQSIKSWTTKPRVLISGSAVGIYGDRGDDWIDESAPSGVGFLSDVAREWEDATKELEEVGVRVVLLRTGIVLSKHGGALAKMLPLYRRGLGGVLGNGQQWMPWIHENDLARLIVWLAESNQVSGPVNACVPNPVRNVEFNKQLGSAVGKSAFLRVPAFALKIVVGEFATALLDSQRVRPKVAIDQNFNFQFEDVGTALADLVRESS